MYELEIYSISEGWIDYEEYNNRDDAYDSIDYYRKNPRLIVKVREVEDKDEGEGMQGIEEYLKSEADSWYNSHNVETGEYI